MSDEAGALSGFARACRAYVSLMDIIDLVTDDEDDEALSQARDVLESKISNLVPQTTADLRELALVIKACRGPEETWDRDAQSSDDRFAIDLARHICEGKALDTQQQVFALRKEAA